MSAKCGSTRDDSARSVRRRCWRQSPEDRRAFVSFATARMRMPGEFTLRAFTVPHAIRRASENNSSIVVVATARNRSMLLTGDIEREAEFELAPRITHVDVLKVAHHGSRSSSTTPLLDAATPRIAIISCGANNWFGHPHASVMTALRERGMNILRTDRNGSIDIVIARTIQCVRQFDTPR